MEEPVGVAEGYTLGEHTQMVLSIFEQQFAGELTAYDPELTRLLRTTLLLQDIGKPLSVALHEGTHHQADYNHDLAELYLQDFDFSPEIKVLITELVGQDVLGIYFKQAGFDLAEKGKGLNSATSSISEIAQKVGFPADDLLNLMTILYISDAASYTAWSKYINSSGAHKNGTPSLESLFTRDDTTGKIDLNPRLQRAFRRLRQAVDTFVI
jgi:hypothetical protein